MKKIKLLLLMIIGYAGMHLSFTTKIVGSTYLILKSNEVRSQPAFYPTANCHMNNYEINQWMSPSNDCGNRFVCFKVSTDSFTFSHRKIIFDSLAKITSSLNTSNKIWTMNSIGNIEPVPYISFIPTTFTVSRTINSATFQVSSTKTADVIYNIAITCTATIAGSSAGKVELQYSINGGSTWITVNELENSNNVTLAIALQSVTKQTASIVATGIPAGAILRLVPTTSGTTSTIFIRGQETY